jgi:hypothetical protein
MRINRSGIIAEIRKAIRSNPVTALYGPRQCGKTTIARAIAKEAKAEYFDLEDPVSAQRLAEPMTALRGLRGLIVIDEVQQNPGLFSVFRVLADRHPLPARFLLLGSASPDLLQRGSQSLAGRIAHIEMGGFGLTEVGASHLRRLWWRGGFPKAYLARNEAESRSWQDNFIRTFLERDIPALGIQVPAIALRRLWMMLAHYHGQVGNSSEIARSLGESHSTVKRHLDLLTGSFMVRQLQPWHENLGKRQVKSAKIYLRDSGLLHALLGVHSFRALEGHPKLGASWEGFVIEDVVQTVGERNVFFWSTQAGAELDLLVMRKSKRYGVEVKYADAPGMTKSMHIALQDLKLKHLFVVYPGDQSYAIHEKVTVVPAEGIRRQLLLQS